MNVEISRVLTWVIVFVILVFGFRCDATIVVFGYALGWITSIVTRRKD